MHVELNVKAELTMSAIVLLRLETANSKQEVHDEDNVMQKQRETAMANIITRFLDLYYHCQSEARPVAAYFH